MTQQAECAHIRKIALAAAFGDRDDVIGVPQRLAAALAQSPQLQELPPGRVVELAHIAPERYRVRPAPGAHAFVPLENLPAQISRIRAQFPIVNAGVGTKRAATARYLSPAPAT